MQLLFSLLLTIRVMMGKDLVDSSEWYFLLTGGVAMENPHKNPAAEWLSDKQWGEFCRVSDIAAFKGKTAVTRDRFTHAGAFVSASSAVICLFADLCVLVF